MEESVLLYVKSNSYFTEEEIKGGLAIDEIGDGNINFVYRVKALTTARSLIVKQATSSFRTDPSGKLSPDRIGFEVGSLMKIGEINPGQVPEIYHYDDKRKAFIMEDCIDYSILRADLMDEKTFPNFGKEIGLFLARLHFYTSDFYLSGDEKKDLTASYINPDLCEITERLVFTEPFTDYLNRNNPHKDLEAYVAREIYDDMVVRVQAAKYKHRFMTQAQALLHGDLHTGSIFINDKDFKVFDSEFAFVGPCGYDLGCIIGNLLFAYIGSRLRGENPKFTQWILTSIEDILQVYARSFSNLVKNVTKDPILSTQGYVDIFVRDVLLNGLATGGVELLRRTISHAKVPDITSLPNEDMKIRGQKAAIDLGKDLLLKCEEYLSKGGDLVEGTLNRTFSTFC